MGPRISMFIAAMLVALVCVPAFAADDAPQCVVNPDGSISCPQLAPQLPASAAAGEGDTEAGRIGLLQRRRLGMTRPQVIRATIKLARAGELPSTVGLSGAELEAAKAEIKEAVTAEIMGENLPAWQEADPTGAEWGEFFEQFAAFLERIMPLILQLIEIFNSFSQAA